jgi:hypothetical protein
MISPALSALGLFGRCAAHGRFVANGFSVARLVEIGPVALRWPQFLGFVLLGLPQWGLGCRSLNALYISRLACQSRP